MRIRRFYEGDIPRRGIHRKCGGRVLLAAKRLIVAVGGVHMYTKLPEMCTFDTVSPTASC